MKKFCLPVLVCLVLLAALAAPALGAGDDGVGLSAAERIRLRPVYVLDDPDAIPVRVLPLPGLQAGSGVQTAVFTITYVASGSTNAYGETCLEFPADAKTAFNAAAAIWGSLLTSAVPIQIEACWANLPSNVLGYSGALDNRRDFSGAPQAGTWYPKALANALHGSETNGSVKDMSIAYANGFASQFYYGTDGNPGARYDFITLVLHEIGHSLGFAGSMYSNGGGTANWGFKSQTGYPSIYDRFTVDSSGHSLINTGYYANPSAALFGALTSGAVYFSGPNTKAANGNNNVSLYAPSSWAQGSSYAHVSTSFDGTANALMTYSLGKNEVIHTPGPIAEGVLKDDGWAVSHYTIATPTVVQANAISAHQVNLTWTDTGSGESGFTIERSPTGSSGWTVLATTVTQDAWYVDTSVVEGTRYYYRVSAVYPGPAASSPSSVVNAITPLVATVVYLTPVSPTRIDLAWLDPNVTETGYKVERSPDGSTGWSTLTTTSANAVSYSNASGLGEGTRYYYRVTALNAITSSPAAAANAWTPLNAPTGLGAVLVPPARVDLAWTDNSGKESGYRVERGPSAGGPWTVLTTTAANVKTYSDSGVVEGGAYFYRVRAVNATPLESAPAVTPAAAVVPLLAPTGLSAALGAAGQVALSWTDVSANETGYKVERGPSAAGPWTLLTTTAPASSYNDTAMAELSTFSYRVTAVNSVTTAQSAPVISNAVTTVLSVPGSLAAAPVLGGGKILVRWNDNSTHETGYQIQWAPAAGGPWTDVVTSAANASSFTWIQPVNGVYFIRVRTIGSPAAVNSVYAGPVSAVLSTRWMFAPVMKK